MNKIKKYIYVIFMVVFFLILACNIQLLANLKGLIGPPESAVMANLGFDTLTDSSTGSGETFRLIFGFKNSAGEFIEFVLSPSDSTGSSPNSLYDTITYALDGSENIFRGSAQVGTAFQSFNATSGKVTLNSLIIDGSAIENVSGSYEANLSEGGSVSGTFAYPFSSE